MLHYYRDFSTKPLGRAEGHEKGMKEEGLRSRQKRGLWEIKG